MLMNDETTIGVIMTTTLSATQVIENLKAASFKGLEEAQSPTPMVVTDGTRQWTISGGMCGSAVVMLKSARGKLAQELKKSGNADVWYGKSGLALKTYSFMGYANAGQSLAYHEAICQAMVDYLESIGVEAYVHSWVD